MATFGMRASRTSAAIESMADSSTWPRQGTGRSAVRRPRNGVGKDLPEANEGRRLRGVILIKTTFRWNDILQAVLDFCFVFGGVLVAVTWFGTNVPDDRTVVGGFALLLAVVMLSVNTWLGLYQRIHNRSFENTVARAIIALLCSIPICYLLFVLFPINPASHLFLLAASLLSILVMSANRVSAAHRRPDVWVKHRVLIFGVAEEAKMVAESLRQSDPTVELVGFYPSSVQEDIRVPHDQLLSRDLSLTDTANTLKVDEIIVAVGERRGGTMPLRELLECRLSGTRIMDLSMHFERKLGQIRLDSLRAGWLIFGDGFRQDFLRAANKRIIDCLAASLLLLLASPIMLVTTVLIVIEDGFQVFYRQQRVGLNGRLFHVIKFRSMRRDAESDGKPRWAATNDDRVTRVGRFIRKFRIDELPQLFCVIRGDMSLVGPRPERPYFVDQLTKKIPFYAVRHSVNPGVTGWAQVRYAYGASVDDAIQKLQYDLFYVKNHNVILDFVILFETVSVVLSGKGAQ